MNFFEGMEMIYKMKSVKNIYKIIKKINKSIDSGKIRLSKKSSVNLLKSVDYSVINSNIGVIEGMISKEDVKVEDTEDTKVAVVGNTPYYVLNHSNFNTEYTLVVPIAKKNMLSIFDFTEDGLIGALLRSSTLSRVYLKVKKEWNKFTSDSAFSVAMFLPAITIFLDEDKCDYKKFYRNVNLLIVAVPSKSTIEQDSKEGIDDKMYCGRIILDVMDATIKNGCKNIIIDPLAWKLQSDPEASINAWKAMLDSKRVKDNVESIVFTPDNEVKLAYAMRLSKSSDK